MTGTDVDAYLRQLDRELRRRFVHGRDILDEVRDHLVDAVESAEREGRSLPDAHAVAIERFGSAPVVAAAYAADRQRAMHRGLFVAAMMFGLAIAHIAAQPTWDDAGVTAGALMLGAACFGLLGPRRAWLWALLAGSWIPAHALVRTPSVGTLPMLIVLVFPLIGAFLGRTVRRLALS
jgi:hypothetical protein